MSITTNDFSFFFKNVQKSHIAVSAFLNEFADGHYDFLFFFQEISRKIYWHAADINNPLGSEIFGCPIHPDWICLPPLATSLRLQFIVTIASLNTFMWQLTTCSSTIPTFFCSLYLMITLDLPCLISVSTITQIGMLNSKASDYTGL